MTHPPRARAFDRRSEAEEAVERGHNSGLLRAVRGAGNCGAGPNGSARALSSPEPNPLEDATWVHRRVDAPRRGELEVENRRKREQSERKGLDTHGAQDLAGEEDVDGEARAFVAAKHERADERRNQEIDEPSHARRLPKLSHCRSSQRATRWTIGLTSRAMVRSQRPAGRETGTLSPTAGAGAGRATTAAMFGVYYTAWPCSRSTRARPSRILPESPTAVRWIGDSPVFVPFQVDRVVEVITPEHPRYRLAWAMRGVLEWRTHARRADDVAYADGALDPRPQFVDKIAASIDGISVVPCDRFFGGARMWHHSSIADSRPGQLSSSARES